MPRAARVKHSDAIYHVMIRSISEVLLYRTDEDKETFLYLIRNAQKKYHFTTYSFCLMNNHAHFIIDPLGGDISEIMHLINSQYATYYNHKYNRRGSLFQGRFKSEIIDSDTYLTNGSIYIHANPKDLPEFRHMIHFYKYSSLLDYINNTNRFGILNTSFLTNILGLDNNNNLNDYINLCIHSTANTEIACTRLEFSPEKFEYRSERHIILRETCPKQIIMNVATYFNFSFNDIHNKRQHKYTEFKSICCYLMSCFCDIPQRTIALILGNMSQSSISKLISKGVSSIGHHPTLLNSLLI